METEFLEYITVTGDTFDMIALDYYDDEFQAHKIIQANPSYSKILIFSAGIVLKIPIIEEEANETLPPWKR